MSVKRIISLSSQHVNQLVFGGQTNRVKLELGGQLLPSLLRAFSLPPDPDVMFLLICIVIFIGSLLAGAVPFVLRVSEQQLELLSAFGAGLLVSTALAVVLPEGVEAFHSAEGETGKQSCLRCVPLPEKRCSERTMLGNFGA